jgi:isocitrate/isopropylmalate dehydrogenase
MAANKKLLILPGDGIGPEVMNEVERIIEWFAKNRAVGFDVSQGLIGGVAYDAHGTPLSDETLDEAMNADAVLLGAVNLGRRPPSLRSAKKWICSPICVRQKYLMLLSMPRR